MRLVRTLLVTLLVGAVVLPGGSAWADKGGSIENVQTQQLGHKVEVSATQGSVDKPNPAPEPPPSRGGGSNGSGARGGGSAGPSYPQHVLDDPGVLNGSMTPDEAVRAQCAMLAVTGNTASMCQPAAPSGPGPAPAAPPPPDPREVARRAVLQLEIPAPNANIGPDPKVNEWKMAVVGYPLWLWTTGPDRIDRTVTEQGITLNLSARRVTTKFDLGDGTVKFCGMTTPYHPGVQPGTESPSCGHRYQEPSLPKGKYSVAATTRWEISWSALGQSGVLPLERQGPVTQLPVGELVSVRTGG